MSSEKNSSKKRKTDDSAPPVPALQSALRDLCDTSSVHIYYGLADFVNACVQGTEEVIRVHHSIYFASVEDFGHYVTPRCLKRFTTVRDDRNSRIIRIHDSTSQIEGPKLSRVMAFDHLINKGYDVIIFAAKGSDTNEALALPRNWEIEEDTSAKKREHVKSILKLYHERGFSRVYHSSAQLCSVLSLGYVSLRKARSVAVKLNNLIERQDFNLDLKSVKDIKSILEHTDTEAKTLEKTFMGELLSCAVEKAHWKAKINAFKKVPSATVARLLELKKPYQGKLYSQSTGRVADMCLLRDLREDDMVLFSTVPVDTKFYSSVTQPIDEWKVYKASPDLGIIKDKKGWVPLAEPIEINAKLTVQLLSTIAKSNASQSKALVVKAKASDSSKDLLDNVDF